MVCRTGFQRDSQKKKFTKGYKGQESVEIPDHRRPKGEHNVALDLQWKQLVIIGIKTREAQSYVTEY